MRDKWGARLRMAENKNNVNLSSLTTGNKVLHSSSLEV